MTIYLRTAGIAALMVSGLALSGCKLVGGGGIAPPTLDPSPPLEGPFEATYKGEMEGNVYAGGQEVMGTQEEGQQLVATIVGDLTVNVNYNPGAAPALKTSEVTASAGNFRGTMLNDREGPLERSTGAGDSDQFVDITIEGALDGPGYVKEDRTGVEFSMSGQLDFFMEGQDPTNGGNHEGSPPALSRYVDLDFDGTFYGADREEMYGEFEGGTSYSCSNLSPCVDQYYEETIKGTFSLDKQAPDSSE